MSRRQKTLTYSARRVAVKNLVTKGSIPVDINVLRNAIRILYTELFGVPSPVPESSQSVGMHVLECVETLAQNAWLLSKMSLCRVVMSIT